MLFLFHPGTCWKRASRFSGVTPYLPGNSALFCSGPGVVKKKNKKVIPPDHLRLSSPSLSNLSNLVHGQTLLQWSEETSGDLTKQKLVFASDIIFWFWAWFSNSRRTKQFLNLFELHQVSTAQVFCCSGNKPAAEPFYLSAENCDLWTSGRLAAGSRHCLTDKITLPLTGDMWLVSLNFTSKCCFI